MKPIIFLSIFLVMFSGCSKDMNKSTIEKAKSIEIKDELERWYTFKHPSKVFTISIPTNWGKSKQFQHNPNVFTFYPSQSSEFTISITQNLNLPTELPIATVKMMFPQETPISEPKRKKGKGWNSIRQDFKGTKNGKSWIWLAEFYGFGSNAIAITLSDSKENIDKYKDLFEEIVNTLSFNN